MRLVCNGYYPEIHVVHPRRLEILFSLCAQIQPDWISALCILRPIKREGQNPTTNHDTIWETYVNVKICKYFLAKIPIFEIKNEMFIINK